MSSFDDPEDEDSIFNKIVEYCINTHATLRKVKLIFDEWSENLDTRKEKT